ncbi:MAG: hypothetical protein ACI8TP_001348 [Acidimicrobiales bacterium]|jgi:hypothetical protein
MKWITWDQAAIAAVVSYLVFAASSRLTESAVTRFVVAASRELGFVAAIYSVWRVARQLPIANETGAIERARWIANFQESLFLPSELSIQRWVVEHQTISEFATGYYAIVHVPSIIAFMIWLFLFKRPFYVRWRTGLAFTTFFCLVIRFLRIAPPRFLPELGFVNLADKVGFKVFGSVGEGVSDQFAAMPSIHIAWAAVVTFGFVASCTGWWRWLMLLHLGITFFVVAATGHHWWLDGIVAVALLGLSLMIDTQIQKRWRVRKEPEGKPRSPNQPEEASRVSALPA